ncbi:MAG: hypothetical protein BVN35_14745 [Proteobacteria bacterium ST_bin11]|nr:MAG: hypothetical protein BVN35_14745 [Proteobacteria bacterium ST_bin11]
MAGEGLENQLVFTLRHWCFWQSVHGPGTRGWPNGEILPFNQGNADVGFLPAMQRRRLSPLARAACAVAWRSHTEHGDMPSVFFSVHGESQYYFEMLEGMANAEPVSPSRFSQCVHNAIAGLSSVHSASYLPYVALAGGTEGLFSAFLEASGSLLEAPQVLLVCYDQALPEIYRSYLPDCRSTWALGMTLARAGEVGHQLRLTREPATDYRALSVADQGLPNMVQAIIAGQRRGSSRESGAIWHWRLDDV